MTQIKIKKNIKYSIFKCILQKRFNVLIFLKFELKVHCKSAWKLRTLEKIRRPWSYITNYAQVLLSPAPKTKEWSLLLLWESRLRESGKFRLRFRIVFQNNHSFLLGRFFQCKAGLHCFLKHATNGSIFYIKVFWGYWRQMPICEQENDGTDSFRNDFNVFDFGLMSHTFPFHLTIFFTWKK